MRRRAEREAAEASPEGSTAAKNLNPVPTPPPDTRRASGRAGTGFASATVAGLDDALVDERITRAHRLQEQHPDISTDDSYALADVEMESARVSPAKAQSGSRELAEAVSSGDPQRALEARLAYGRIIPIARLGESGDAESVARYKADVGRLDKMSLLELGDAVLTGPKPAEPIEAQGAMKTHAVRDLRDSLWLSFGATAYLPAALAQEIGEIFNYDAGLQGFSEMGWAYSGLGEAVGNYATDRDVQTALSGEGLTKTVVRMGVKSGLTDAYAWAAGDADLAQFSRDATALPDFDAPAAALYTAASPEEKRTSAERMGALAYGMLPEDLRRKDAELLALVRQDAREGRLTGAAILNDLANGVADSVLLGTISRTSLDELGAGIAPSVQDINKTHARRAAVMQATGGPEADRLGELVLGGLYDVDREADSKIWLKPSKMQHILAVVGVAPEVFYEADIPLLPEFIADAAGTEGWLAKLAHLRIPTKAGLESMAQTGAYDDMLTSWGMKKGSEWATLRDPDSSYTSRIAANILNPEFQGLGLQGVYRRGGGQVGSGIDKGLGTGDVLADFLFDAESVIAAPVMAAAKTGVNAAKAARFAPKGVKLAAARSQLPSRLRPANLRGLDADAALVKTVVDGIESGAARGQLPNEHQLKITENVDEMLRSTGASPEAVRESMVKYAQESGAQSLDDIGQMVNRAGTPEVQALRKTPDYLRVQREIEAVAAADNDLPASQVPVIMAMEEWAAHVAVATGNVGSLDDYFKGTQYAAGGAPGPGAYLSADGTPSPRGVEEAGIVDSGDAMFVREPDAPVYTPRTFDEMVTDGDVEEVLTHLRRQNPELGEVRAEQVRKRVQDSLGNIRRLDLDAKDALDRAAASSGDVGRAQFDVAVAKRQSARNAREALRVELDNEARKAKATPPVRSQRTGTDAVDARLGAAKRFEDVSPSDVRDADRLLEMLGHPLEGGRFKVAKKLNKDNTAIGSYQFAQDIVSLAQRAFDEGMSTRTLAHEIGHRVSTWLPKEKAADLLRQYVKERKVAMRKNPEWFGEGGRFTAENNNAAYRWSSVDEWFAERFADYASKRLTQLDAAGRSVMDAAMFMLEKIKARIVEFFGIDAVPGVIEDLMAGKLDRVVADAQAPLRSRLMMTGVTDVSGHGMRPQSGELFSRVSTAPPTTKGVLIDPNNPQHLVSYEVGKSTPDVHAQNTAEMYAAGDIPRPKTKIKLTLVEKKVLALLESGVKLNHLGGKGVRSEARKALGLSTADLYALVTPDSPIMRVVNERAEHAIKHLQDNIVFAVRSLPKGMADIAKVWYEGAHDIANTFALRYGVAPKVSAAVLAALSPNADWFQNVSMAERLLDIYHTKMDHVWDPKMDRVALNPTGQKVLPFIKGRALKDVEGSLERAVWIMVYDGAYNGKTFRSVNPDGSFGDVVRAGDGAGADYKFSWGYPSSTAKAVAILDNPTQASIYDNLGWAHKVRNFYNNILDPNHSAGDVTIDTHAVAAARWRPLGGESREVKKNFGGAGSGETGHAGSYYLYAEAYRRAAAAEIPPLQPRQLQSIVWESARGQLYKKTSAAQKEALATWKAYTKGEITADAARIEINRQQGARDLPPWLRPDHAVFSAEGTSSYAGKLSVNRTPESELRSRTLDGGGVRDDSPGVLAVSDPTAGRYDPQTPGFRTFIEGSAAVNADKTPKVLYIGTTHEFDALDPELGNVQNHHGRATYMSSSPEDVSENYATRTGPDITSRIENLHESLVDALDDPNAASAMVEAWAKGNPDRAEEVRNLLVALDDPFADVASDAMDYSSKTPSSLLLRDIARWNAEQQIAGTHGGAILPVYAAIKNPVDLRPGQVTRFDIDTQWSPDGEDLLGESGLGVDVLEAIRRMTGSDPSLADRIISQIDTTDGFTASQLEAAVRDAGDAFIDDFNGEPSSPGQFLQDLYREVGFDGIVLNADEAFGSGGRHRSPMAGVSPDTEHWVAFESTQVKSATGNAGAYDTSDPRLIRSPVAVGPSKSLVIDPPPPVAPAVLPERAPGDAQWGDARGPVGWWMPLDEAEEALGGMAYEHAVVYDGQGRQLARWGPEDTEKARPGLDLTSRCVVYPSVLDELAKAGDGLYTHNHPSGAPPSIEDLVVAHRGNVAEIRAVANGAGFTWVVKRPAGGWPSLEDMRAALREISDAAYPTARGIEVRRVLAAGGNPADGPGAVGYSESAWRRTYADALPSQWEQSAKARRLGLVLERVPHRGQLGLDSSVLPGAAGAAPGARPPAAGGPPGRRGPVGVVRSPDAPYDRLGLTHKEASARVPEVAEAARRLFRGEITKTEFAAVVDRAKPVTPYAEVPTPATNEAMTSAVSAEKRGAVNAASALPAGSPVGLRLDIPAYTNHGTWVVTVHEGKASGAGGAAGKMIGYQSTATIRDAQFGVAQKGAFATAQGKAKDTFATIGGKWVPSTPEEALARAQAALNDPEWVQVGMDPERHGYFYDRATMQPVVSAEEAIQVGPLVLAKKPVYGEAASFLYSPEVPAYRGEGGKPRTATLFSGVGMVEVGLRGKIDPVFAVEADPAIGAAHQAAHGTPITIGKVQDVDISQAGDVDYLHASPVCKTSSTVKNIAGGGEQPLDLVTAKATADAIRKAKPRVFTLENVKGYRNTEAMKVVEAALREEGYTFDVNVYDAADYGAATHRERLLLRAVKGGELPPVPAPTHGPGRAQPHADWYATVEDLVDALPDSEVPPFMRERLSNAGINADAPAQPLIVFGGSGFKGQVPHALAGGPAPTIKANPGEVHRIILPDGRVKRVTPQVLARITGLPDDFVLPANERLAQTVIGNGVPPALSREVFGPLLDTPTNVDPRLLYSRTGPTIHGSIEPIRGERVPGQVRNPARDAWIAKGKAQAAKVAALEEAEVQAWWETVKPEGATVAGDPRIGRLTELSNEKAFDDGVNPINISDVQREFRIDYNQAAALLDEWKAGWVDGIPPTGAAKVGAAPPAPKTIAEAQAWWTANGTDPELSPEPSADLLRETGALEAMRKGGPPKTIEDTAVYAGHLIRLFKTGDFDTWLHEFSHRIRFEMGDAWTDDLVKFFDNEPDPARAGKMRLTTKGEEQLAEAARIHLRGKLHPNGRLRSYVDDVVGYMREMWLRLRGKPLDVPEGFRVWWDMVLDPAKAVKRPMVDLQADRLSPTELPTVVGRDDIDILREKNPVAAVGKKREEFRVALDPRRARQALGVKVGDTEADALSLYARAYGEVVLGQFRRVWGGEDLVRMGTSVVPRSRAKKIEKTVRGKLDTLLGGEWKPNTDGSFTLTPQQQAAAKTLIDEVAAEPLGEALPVALTERNADLSTISMEDWNALNTALIDVHAGPGAWRDLRAENAAVGGLKALINVLDERYFTTGTLLGDTKAQMKRWFVVEDVAGSYMQNIGEREALEQVSRRLGGVGDEIRKKVAAIKRKDPDADISQFYREIAGNIAPTIDPNRAVAVGKMHGSLGNANTTDAVFDAMDVADTEFGGVAAVLGSSRRGVSSTETSALATLEAARTAVRAGTLSPADLAADAAYIDALSITQSALKRRFQAMQQVADEVILAFSGGDKSVLTGYGSARGGDNARVVRLYTDWFDSPGEWPRIWTELAEQGRQSVEKAGGSYNPNAAILAALIRLRGRAILSEYFDGLLTRLPAMDPELVGKRGIAFEQAARMGDRGDGMEGHANRVQHYLNALTTWKTTNLALVDAAGKQVSFNKALGLDVEGLADFDAYADAQRVLAGIGWKYGEGAGWTRYVVGDREVLLPDLLVTEIDGVIERTSKLGSAWSTDWARGGRPGTGAGKLDSLLRPIAETVQWTLGMARIGLTTGLIIPNPAYFIGNAFGGMLQAYEGMGLRGVLDIGRSAVFLPGERASMTRGVMARIWNDGIGLNYYRPNTPPIITPSGAVWTADAIADAYTRFGLNTSFAKAESPRALLDDIERQQGRWMQRWKQDKWMPARYWQNTLMETATSIDNFYRTASFIDGLKRGMSPEQAAETARLIGFDYGALTDFEKNVARNTVMFYSYMRRNVDLTLWTMINHPGRIATQLRGARGLQQYWLNNDSEAYVPEYLDGRFLLYYHEAIAATKDVPGTANAKRGTAIFSPPVPAGDFLGLFVDGLNAIDGDPNATRELGARLTPWAQALIVATTQKELFSGRDVQQYNTVPGWVVETSRLWDGGIFADNFLQVEPIGQMDPSLEVNPGADRYQARNGVGWWMFRNLTPAGRPMDTLSQMARADFGESVFGEGGVVQAGVDMLKVYREAGGSLDIVAEPLSRAVLPDEGPNLWEPVDTSPDLDTARPGLTEWEELMALYGFKPIQLDTADMVADRAAKDLSSAARQRTSVLKKADPFR